MLNYRYVLFCPAEGSGRSRPSDERGVVIQTLREGDLSQKIFLQPFGPQFGLNIRGGPGPLPWIHHWRERVKQRRARGSLLRSFTGLLRGT